MATITATTPSIGAANGTDAATGSSSYPSDLAGLQRKLVGLMKEMKDATADRSPGAIEHVKLLQIEIQACQMQIQHVQQAAAQKAAVKTTPQSDAAHSAAPARQTLATLGANIDTTA